MIGRRPKTLVPFAELTTEVAMFGRFWTCGHDLVESTAVVLQCRRASTTRPIRVPEGAFEGGKALS